jgi:hypothetical protein
VEVPVPEEIRHRLSVWCAAAVPEWERAQRQIGYTIQGDAITILDRRPPAYPELGAAWTATPLAQLRVDDPEPGRWSLYRRVGESDAWTREGPPGEDPLVLLERVTG